MRGAWYAIVSLLCAVAAGATAQQRQPGPALNWVRNAGAESCIGSVELARLVETRFGQALFVPAPDAVLAIEGSVMPAAQGGFDAEIAVSDGRGTLFGTRELHAAGDCRELDEPLALVIAVTLRPSDGSVAGITLPPDVLQALDALFGEEPSDPELQALPRVQAGTTPAAPPASAQRPASGGSAAPDHVREFGVALEPGIWIASGLQPDGAFGPVLGLRAVFDAIGAVRLRAALSLATAQDFTDGTVRGETRFQVFRAALAYCSPELVQAPLAIVLCGGPGIGATHVSADGFAEHNDGARRFWFAAALDAELGLALAGPLSLLLSLGGEVRTPRAQFVYTTASEPEPRTVFRTEALAPSASLGLSMRLF